MTEYFYSSKQKTPPYLTVPLFLMEDETYRNITSEAKLLYGIMLRRVDLSRKTGWKDENGRIYQFYPIAEVMAALHCCKQKAVDTLRELEAAELLERRNQGQGKPSKLFLKIPSTAKSCNVGCKSDSYLSEYEEILMRSPVF